MEIMHTKFVVHHILIYFIAGQTFSVGFNLNICIAIIDKKVVHKNVSSI